MTDGTISRQTGHLEHIPEGEADKAEGGWMTLKNTVALRGRGQHRIERNEKPMKRPSSCSGAK